jgi:hypothetical protein
MRLMGQQLGGSADLAQLTAVENGNPSAHVRDDIHVMGHENDGQPQLALQTLESAQNLNLDRSVQRRRGLVGNQKGRPP